MSHICEAVDIYRFPMINHRMLKLLSSCGFDKAEVVLLRNIIESFFREFASDNCTRAEVYRVLSQKYVHDIDIT